MAIQFMLYQLSINTASDVGLVRQNNEDYFKVMTDEQFFVLADGMGGHRAGEIASRKAVEELCRLFSEERLMFRESLDIAEQLLAGIIKSVNSYIYQLGKGDREHKGMGTTLCVLFFHPEGLILGHVGDSRIYRMRRGKLDQLTKDHSLMRELIDLGQLNEGEAEVFLYKNIITRAVGTDMQVVPSVRHTSVEVGDYYLMCSDGLTDMVPLDEIEEVLKNHSEDKAVKLLVETAKKNGGYDNITLVLVKVQEAYESNLL